MKLSIVATLYQSAPYIIEFYQRATAAAKTHVGEDYEIVLVNDGSPDNSLDLAIRLTEQDSHLVVVDLSRNFGHHKAMMTGLAYAKGQQVFLIDSDLEEEPEFLLSFAEQMQSEACDVVYGVQEQRKGEWFERWSGELFYSIFNRLSDIDHPKNIITARLMTRRYVDALLTHREREVIISYLWVLTGFKQNGRLVKKHSNSATTYSLRKRIVLAVNGITSFSEMPLKLMFYIGMIVFFVALTYAGYLTLGRIFFYHTVDGWTSVMVSVWVLGGMMISFLGIIGIYLAKIYSETKRRPLTIVRNIYGRSAPGSG
jgi:putative glycosyltransferase